MITNTLNLMANWYNEMVMFDFTIDPELSFYRRFPLHYNPGWNPCFVCAECVEMNIYPAPAAPVNDFIQVFLRRYAPDIKF